MNGSLNAIVNDNNRCFTSRTKTEMPSICDPPIPETLSSESFNLQTNAQTSPEQWNGHLKILFL